MDKVKIYQGMADTLPFRIKDRMTGQALDLTDASFLLAVRRSPGDSETVFTKTDSDFGKTAAASGYVTTFLSAWDTWRDPWVYRAELMVTMPADGNGNVRIIKLEFDLEILPSATPNDWTLAVTGIVSQEALGTPLVANI